MFGLVILTLLCLSAIFAPLLTPYDPDKVNLRERSDIPSLQHWMGTDEVGRDVFTGVINGGRISLTVGFVVAIIGTLIGGIIGATSAYVGGPVDEGAMRFVDVLRSLPTLPILIVLSQVLRVQFGVRGGIWIIVLILIIFSWTGIARIIRGNIISLKHYDYVLAAESVGVPGKNIVGRPVTKFACPADCGSNARSRRGNQRGIGTFFSRLGHPTTHTGAGAICSLMPKRICGPRPGWQSFPGSVSLLRC